MLNNKILFILIICVGIVVSVYLVTKKSEIDLSPTENSGIIGTNSYINLNQNSNDNWKKILMNIDSSRSTTTVLTNVDPDMFDETTLTGQMSRDFLSQYLASIKGGALTPEELTKVVENTLSVPGYDITGGAKYIASNLKTTTKSDSKTLQTYKNAVNLILKNRSSQIKEDPSRIFQDAINSASETKIAKLDPIILTNKNFIVDFLNVEVPEKAIQVHLALLNASSNILFDLEAMRVVFVDPVRSLLAIGQYPQHVQNLKIALENLDKYFSQN